MFNTASTGAGSSTSPLPSSASPVHEVNAIVRHGNIDSDDDAVNTIPNDDGSASNGTFIDSDVDSEDPDVAINNANSSGKGTYAFDSKRCLFCNDLSLDIDENLIHMSKKHGMTIPQEDKLLVDTETLLGYMHLVISEYFECLYCGSQRRTAQAARQHMLAQRHCHINISDPYSDFRDFYDFEEKSDKEDTDQTSVIASVQPDETTLRLPSGKLLSHRSSPKPHKPATTIPSRPRNADTVPSISTSAPSSSTHISKAETREMALTRHLSRLRTEDRRSLMHLPGSQQRAMLVVQKKQIDRAARKERDLQGRVQGLGNKTLMKRFVNDVPGRSNG